ncbi:MAG: lysylphosphatidylglycerol synthase transmembrane domain-containing protein [candidate division Zixibacteria bacterium]
MKETIEDKSVRIKDSLLSFRTLIGFSVSAVILYLFFRNFDLSEAMTTVSRANWIYIVLAFFVYYISLPLRGGRWGKLLKPAGHTIGYGPLSRYYFLSWFANALLPARIGDIYRAYLLKKNKGVSVSLSLGVLFSERVFDLVVIAALTAASGAYFVSYLKGTAESDYLVFGFMAVMLILVFFIAAVFGIPSLINLAPEKWRLKLTLFSSGLFKSPTLIPIIILMTLLIWMSEALRLFFVFKAFGLEIGFLGAVFISQAALIIMAVPLSPAGLGLVEILMLKILTSSGIITDLAGAVTLVDRIISYWSLLILGAITYFAGSGDK